MRAALNTKPQPVAEAKTYDVNALFSAREEQRHAFIESVGWDDATLTILNEDCAFRRYYRLTRGAESILVLDSIPELEDVVAPSHKLSDYVRISEAMRAEGIPAPQVYAHDLKAGYGLIEDWGDTSFNAALKAGADEAEMYAAATDILVKMRESKALARLEMRNYYDTHVHANRVDIVNWYYPAVTGQALSKEAMQAYLEAWVEIENNLPPCPMGFTHCDFHVDNLMIRGWDGKRPIIGVLDFQGAVTGPLPYDLANLLEDARRSVSPELKATLKAQYCADMTEEHSDVFNAWYRVLATQFHCRVIGLFVRLLVRDNKPIHIHHIPRLQNYIKDALKDPMMAPLKGWFEEYKISLDFDYKEIDVEATRNILKLK